MAVTEYRGYALPYPTRSVKDEFWNFALVTLPAIDLDMQSLFDALGGKSAIGHGHAIGDVTGLQAALDGKMPASYTFTLAGLSDVVGVDEAPDGYVLVKLGAQMVAQAAAAALGVHSHSIAQVTNLQQALDAKLPSSMIWKGSQAAYDAIATKDPYVLYFIT